MFFVLSSVKVGVKMTPIQTMQTALNLMPVTYTLTKCHLETYATLTCIFFGSCPYAALVLPSKPLRTFISRRRQMFGGRLGQDEEPIYIVLLVVGFLVRSFVFNSRLLCSY